MHPRLFSIGESVKRRLMGGWTTGDWIVRKSLELKLFDSLGFAVFTVPDAPYHRGTLTHGNPMQGIAQHSGRVVGFLTLIEGQGRHS